MWECQGRGGDGEESGRPFGLEDCPVFEPTEEEFRDPMGYVKKIENQGRRYGMVKIIPPKGWKMPFVTDTEVRSRSFSSLSMPFRRTFPTLDLLPFSSHTFYIVHFACPPVMPHVLIFEFPTFCKRHRTSVSRLASNA